MENIFYTALKENSFQTAWLILREQEQLLSSDKLNQVSEILGNKNFYAWWYIYKNKKIWKDVERGRSNKAKALLNIDNFVQKSFKKIDQLSFKKQLFYFFTKENNLSEVKYLIENTKTSMLKKCNFYDERIDSVVDLPCFIYLSSNLSHNISDLKKTIDAFIEKGFDVNDFQYNFLSLAYEKSLRLNNNLVFKDENEIFSKDFLDFFILGIKNLPVTIKEKWYENKNIYPTVDSKGILKAIQASDLTLLYSNIREGELYSSKNIETNENKKYKELYEIYFKSYNSKIAEIKKELKCFGQKYGSFNFKKDYMGNNILKDILKNVGSHNLLFLSHLIDQKNHDLDWFVLDKEGDVPFISLLNFIEKNYLPKEKKYNLNASDQKRIQKIEGFIFDDLNKNDFKKRIITILDTVKDNYLKFNKEYLLFDQFNNLDVFLSQDNIYSEKIKNIDGFNEIKEKIIEIKEIKRQYSFYFKSEVFQNLLKQLDVFILPDKYNKSYEDNEEYYFDIVNYLDENRIAPEQLNERNIEDFSGYLLEIKDKDFFKNNLNIYHNTISIASYDVLNSFKQLPEYHKNLDINKKIFFLASWISNSSFFLNDKNDNSDYFKKNVIINAGLNVSLDRYFYNEGLKNNNNLVYFNNIFDNNFLNSFYEKHKNIILRSFRNNKELKMFFENENLKFLSTNRKKISRDML